MNKQQISIIVAMNQERVIGSANQLPWHIPEDLAYFKQVTQGKPILMGRKTFESIGRVLPGRKNIVISRSGFSYTGVSSYASLDAAINDNAEAPELCIIGGGEIFSQGLEIATILHITQVVYPVSEPCAWFPVFALNNWEQLSYSTFISSTGINCSITVYQRIIAN